MGIFSILGALTGGSKRKQMSESQSSSMSQSSGSSWNQAYPWLQGAFSPQMGQSAAAGTLLGTLLGFNGQMDQEQAYGLWRNTPGYQFAREEGLRSIDGQKSGAGSFLSGDTLKSLMKYGTGIADQTYGSYMDRLTGQQGAGISIGQMLAGAGDRSEQSASASSQSTSKSKDSSVSTEGGLFDAVGKVAGLFASDRRLKKDIVKIGQLENGLNVYQFTYIDGVGPCIGVMADEVKNIQPEALGPTIPGTDYMTVNYGLIQGLEQYAS